MLGDVLLCLEPKAILPYRLVFLPLTLLVFTRMLQCDRSSLGLTMRPMQGWGYWIKATLVIGAFMAVVVGGWLVDDRVAGGGR